MFTLASVLVRTQAMAPYHVAILLRPTLIYSYVKCLTDLYNSFKKDQGRASLVAQWLGVCLPMQGTRVRALVWEDPTCRGAAKPVSHSY